MRQRRRAAGEPRAAARARDGASPRDRRGTRPRRSATDYRKRAHLDCGRRAGAGDRVRRNAAVQADRDSDGAAHSADVPDGSPGARLQRCCCRRERGDLRPRAGAPGVTHGSDRRDQDRRHRRTRTKTPLGPGRGHHRPGGGIGRPAGRRHVHLSRFPRAVGERTRLPDRSPPDDGLRHEPDPVQRGAVGAVLRPGRRTRARGRRCAGRVDDDVDSDVERFDRHRANRARGLRVPAGQGGREHAGRPGGRILFRRDGDRAREGPQLQPARRRHGSARGHRQSAPRRSLLAESGSAGQALPPEDCRQRLGRDRRRRQDEQVPLRGRAADRLRLSALSAEPVRIDVPAGPVGGRSGRARGAAARDGPRSRRQHADLQRADDGGALPHACGQHLQRDRHHGRRHGVDGAWPVDRRALRPGGVCGQPPDARDRHPHGDRRHRAELCFG